MNAPLLTPQAVAKYLGVSPQWVIDHSNGKREPQIPRVKLGHNVRFRQDDIDAFVERCRKAA